MMLTKLAVGLAVLGAAAAAVPTNRRSLSTVPILNYYPGSSVVDHNRIDIDQAALEGAMTGCGADANTGCDAGVLGANGLVAGIYENGGGSAPQAVCTINDGNNVVTGGFSKKVAATYTNAAGVTGTSKTSAAALAGSDTIKIYYATSSVRANAATVCIGEKVRPYVQDTTSPIVPASCMGNAGTIEISGTTYNVDCANVQAARTLQGFSTKAKKLMYTPGANGAAPPAESTTGGYRSGVPYTSFKPYFDYYCGTNTGCNSNGGYADNIVQAAITGGATDLTNANINFATAAGRARQEVIKKATAYMHAWMYAIREFEDAIDDCIGQALTDNELSSDDAVHAWDEGVAFYVGSLHGDWGPGYSISGKLAYDLGNKRCKNFATCGPDGGETSGQSQQNYKLFQLFQEGQVDFRLGNCAPVVPVKNKIVQWMTIPLVQGTLRYAFETGTLAGTLKGKAEGAIFAMAVLPQVHACSAAAATTIEAEMVGKFHSGRADFKAVKAAFESCYDTMFPDINACEAVGTYGGDTGTTDHTQYGTTKCGPPSSPSAPPSSPSAPPSSPPPSAPPSSPPKEREEVTPPWAIAIIAIIGALFVFTGLGFCYLIKMEKDGKPLFVSMTKTASSV